MGDPAPGRGRGPSCGPTELRLRVLSALVLAPLALAATYFGGWIFVGFWALAALGVAFEWTSLVAVRSRGPLLVIQTVALIGAAALLGVGRPLAAAGLVLGAAALAAVLGPAGLRRWSAAGGIYGGAMLFAPVVLRSDAKLGFVALLLLFAVVWATDILAYFVGRAVGGPKLWPAVSPHKTWSGAVGGVLAALAVGLSVVAAAGLGRWSALALIIVTLSAASQVGDLMESAFKRRFGAKDTSHLIPGHGGLMDRLDGFVAAAVVALLVGLARGGFHAPAQGLLLW